MRLWLSRQRDGTYMLTRLQPTKHRVGATEHFDWYMVPGEPIGVRHLCSMGTKALFRLELEIGEQCQVELNGTRKDAAA